MELKLHTYDDAPEGLIEAQLCLGKAPAPYDESANFVAISRSCVQIYVPSDAEFPFMRCGRILASHGIFKVKLIYGGEFEPWDGLNFLNALYSGEGKTLTVALPLSRSALRTITWMFAMVATARGLADLSSADCSPEIMMQSLGEICKNASDLTKGKLNMAVFSSKDEQFKRYSGLNAVGSGAHAVMGVIEYIPEGLDENHQPDVALVGKGITFDSGGYNIKPDNFMADMRTDKTAAVNLACALALAVGMGLKRHVRCYLACAQNLINSNSMVPGDIIRYPNGVEVEVGNTDAEGRLVLADALLQAKDDGCKYIIDAATLTGSAKAAVGRDMCSVITRDNKMPKSLHDAFALTGELYWQLPFYKFHERFISSRRATISNSGHGVSVPGASTAAAFLSHFVGDEQKWVHIDLSSAYLPEGSPFLAPGPTGAIVIPIAMWLLGESLD